MARANAAYYATHDPFADFTTAPEITQVFGELLGLWAAVVWDGLGRPNPVMLAEAGPGRGTLMADALRAVRRAAPAFAAALSVHLIETSPRLRAAQARSVPGAVWHDALDTIPPAPLILLANEFLDALPVRQFVRRGAGWTERHVSAGLMEEHSAEAPEAVRAKAIRTGAGEGAVLEVCEPALAFVHALAGRLATRPGAALILDYGPAESLPGDSLQAIRDRRAADPLAAPGTADLTAHVDFAALAGAASFAGATVQGPVPQGVFLARLGLFQRTDRLARGQPPRRAMALIDAARRLAEPVRMGRLFKALGLCHPDRPPLPGFDE